MIPTTSLYIPSLASAKDRYGSQRMTVQLVQVGFHLQLLLQILFIY